MATLTPDKFESLNKLEQVGAVLDIAIKDGARFTAAQARTLLRRAKNEIEELMTRPYASYTLLSCAHWFNEINYNLDCTDAEYDMVWKEITLVREEMYSKIEKYIKAN